MTLYPSSKAQEQSRKDFLYVRSNHEPGWFLFSLQWKYWMRCSFSWNSFVLPCVTSATNYLERLGRVPPRHPARPGTLGQPAKAVRLASSTGMTVDTPTTSLIASPVNISISLHRDIAPGAAIRGPRVVHNQPEDRVDWKGIKFVLTKNVHSFHTSSTAGCKGQSIFLDMIRDPLHLSKNFSISLRCKDRSVTISSQLAMSSFLVRIGSSLRGLPSNPLWNFL